MINYHIDVLVKHVQTEIKEIIDDCVVVCLLSWYRYFHGIYNQSFLICIYLFIYLFFHFFHFVTQTDSLFSVSDFRTGLIIV